MYTSLREGRYPSGRSTRTTLTAVSGACTAAGFALLTPTARPPVAVVLGCPEDVLRVPLDFIELPVSFGEPDEDETVFATGGEAFLLATIGFSAAAGATGSAFLLAEDSFSVCLVDNFCGAEASVLVADLTTLAFPA